MTELEFIPECSDFKFPLLGTDTLRAVTFKKNGGAVGGDKFICLPTSVSTSVLHSHS